MANHFLKYIQYYRIQNCEKVQVHLQTALNLTAISNESSVPWTIKTVNITITNYLLSSVLAYLGKGLCACVTLMMCDDSPPARSVSWTWPPRENICLLHPSTPWSAARHRHICQQQAWLSISFQVYTHLASAFIVLSLHSHSISFQVYTYTASAFKSVTLRSCTFIA